ncbi:MAG: substrate-binding domain-containing protein [Armatimonadota bacterium]
MRRIAAVVSLAAVLVLGGCGRKEPPSLTVLCGGSFRPPMEELVSLFEEQTGVPVQLSFGQSEDLLPTVKIGEEGDVFVTHDPYLDFTEEAGALLDSVQVGYVAPALVVRKGNPAEVRLLEDLAKPGVKVALPDPEFSTCGEMLFRLLEKKGIKEAVVANAEGAVFRSHSETGNALKLGTRDAGVMWNGTANTFRDAIDIVPTPYEYDETIRVWIMGLNYSTQQELLQEFLDFCRDQGPDVFADHGYVK